MTKPHRQSGKKPWEKIQKPRRSPSGPKIRPSLYGFHAVHEAWLNPARDVEALYLTPQAAKGFEQILHAAQEKGLRRPDPIEIDKDTLGKALPKGAVHQGIALACAPLPESDTQDFIIQAQTKETSVLVMLDQVTDPHNVGALLRSAAAFGLDGMVMQKKHAPVLDGVLAKTACGAVEHVPVAQETNLSRTLEDLKDAGFFIIGLDERGQQTLDAFAKGGVPAKSVIVLGSEGEGLRRLIKEKCDILLRLPTQNPIASLNVSNAGAVAFYAVSSA